MSKTIITLAAFTILVACDSTPGGNKNILPANPADKAAQHSAQHHGQDKQAHHNTQDEHHSTKHQNAKEGSQLDNNGNYIYQTGKPTQLTLNNLGETLNVGNRSTEYKLLAFLSDDNEQVSQDKTKGWITLDRTYFQLNSSELTPESKTQLENLGKILQEYPTAQVKIGGYTDNQGADEVNLKVSGQRAQQVATQLQTLGITATRIQAEGYGKEHPICPANDTDDCKAQNRRVDIRVTKK